MSAGFFAIEELISPLIQQIMGHNLQRSYLLHIHLEGHRMLWFLCPNILFSVWSCPPIFVDVVQMKKNQNSLSPFAILIMLQNVLSRNLKQIHLEVLLICRKLFSSL